MAGSVTVDRLVVRPGEAESPRVERVGNTWHVRAVDLSRQVLREKDATTQAGFLVEATADTMATMRPPILWMDGAEHRSQRAKTARFFAPKTVDARYRDLMETRSDALIDEALQAGEVVVDQLALRYSVGGGQGDRADQQQDRRARQAPDQAPQPGQRPPWREAEPVPDDPAEHRHDAVGHQLLPPRRPPAIKARQSEPQEDVITHLLSEGYTPQEVLTECVTYAAAGMVTTRSSSPCACGT